MVKLRGRRRTSGADDIQPPLTLPITPETVRAVLRDLRQRTRLQRGFLPGSRTATESRESVYPRFDHGQSGAGGQELTNDRQRNLETDIPSVYRHVAGEQPLSKMMTSGQRSNQVMWQRLDSEISLRRPVPVESLASTGQLSRGEEEVRRRQRGDSQQVRAVDTHQVLRRQGDDGRSSILPQSSSSSVDGRQHQSVQLRGAECGVVGAQAVSNDRRTAHSDRDCSSPTIDKQALGITKADVCRCHGTFEHGIFRRDTTPEHGDGDRYRLPSTISMPVVYCGESPKAESSFIKDEPRSARSSDNDNDSKQDQSHVIARSFQEPSAESQHRVVNRTLQAVIATLGTASHASVKQLQSRSELILVHCRVEMIAMMRMQDVIAIHRFISF